MMGSRTSRRVLEFQADRIEAVLARHKVSARVTGGMVAPRWLQFQVLPALGQSVSKVRGLAEELAVALDADTCRISRQGKLMTVEIPRADPQGISLLPLLERLREQGSIPFCTAVLGLADDGAPLLVRLPAPQVSHLLIAGTTGSGKSVLAQTVIASLALQHDPEAVQFVLIDPKRRGFGPLAGLPHLLGPVLYEPEEMEATLGRLVRLMLDRDRDGDAPTSGTPDGEPRIVVVIDELADLLMAAPKAERPLQRLAQRGRAAGIHLVACTQKPASQVVGSLTKANFPVRLVGQVTSPEDAKVATGYAGTGAEHLRGPGDFIAVTGGQMTRFQAAFASTRELQEVVERLRGNGKALMVVDLPEPEVEEAPVDAELARRVELAREVWRDEYRGDGEYAWGGKGRIAQAIFEDESTSTAGHRFAAVQAVCGVLEREAELETTATEAKRLMLRSKATGEVFESVVVVFDRERG